MYTPNLNILKPTISYGLVNHKNENRITVVFAFNANWLQRIKKVEGAKWSHSMKCWHIPDTAENRTKCAVLKVKDDGPPPVVKNIAAKMVATYKKPAQKVTALTFVSMQNKKAAQSFLQFLQLKSYSHNTVRTYSNEFGIFLKTLGNVYANDLSISRIKDYLAYCATTLKLSENTIHSRMNAIKFYYEQVLHREKFFWEIPRPKKPMKLPKVISEEKILEGLCAVNNMKHKTLLLLAYIAGLRVSEVVALKITDINSDRMQVLIREGKGKKDRMVTLSLTILLLLRQYYKAYKPAEWLFEGQAAGGTIALEAPNLYLKMLTKHLDCRQAVVFTACGTAMQLTC